MFLDALKKIQGIIFVGSNAVKKSDFSTRFNAVVYSDNWVASSRKNEYFIKKDTKINLFDAVKDNILREKNVDADNRRGSLKKSID